MSPWRWFLLCSSSWGISVLPHVIYHFILLQISGEESMIYPRAIMSSLILLVFESLRLAYRSQFGKLGRMIAEYPRIQEQSRFLFIPSPDDAGGFCVLSCSCLYISLLQSKFWYVLSSGPSSVLPRCALPKYLTEELQKEIPNALFMSNPCRYNATLHYSCLEAW